MDIKELKKDSNTISSDNPDLDLHVTEKVDKELNEELKGKSIIKFVDVWKYPSLAERYHLNMFYLGFKNNVFKEEFIW